MDHDQAAMTMPMIDAGTQPGVHGGLVEIDDEGRAVRTASTADPARPGDLLMAYSLLPLPDIDRVLVTNSSMRDEDRSGHTYQIFRLHDLKWLSTNDFDAPAGRYGEINPEEARLGPDGAVYVQTVGCGIERVTDIASDHSSAVEASLAIPGLLLRRAEYRLALLDPERADPARDRGDGYQRRRSPA